MTGAIDDSGRYIDANRTAWNEAEPHHRRHPQYARLLESFAAPGYSCLDETLTGALADLNVSGKSVAQICCNNGRELLSVGNMGAARCVGFDQSAGFLAQGRGLAWAAGIDARFVEADVHDIPREFDGAFDFALITIGVFGWMPDLRRFLEAPARLLRPGGHLVIYEEHPVLNMVGDEETDKDDRSVPAPLRHSYFRTEPFEDKTGLDYWSGQPYDAPPHYWFPHTLGAVVTGVLAQDLRLRRLEEFAHDISEKEWLAHRAAQLPLSYLLVAEREG